MADNKICRDGRRIMKKCFWLGVGWKWNEKINEMSVKCQSVANLSECPEPQLTGTDRIVPNKRHIRIVTVPLELYGASNSQTDFRSMVGSELRKVKESLRLTDSKIRKYEFYDAGASRTYILINIPFLFLDLTSKCPKGHRMPHTSKCKN